MENKKRKLNLAEFATFVYETNAEVRSLAEQAALVNEDEPLTNTPPPHQQDLRVTLDKRLKGEKKATIIYNFVGDEDTLIALGKDLKLKCGVGGSVKDGEIILQGDCLEKVKAELKAKGYRFKVAGV